MTDADKIALHDELVAVVEKVAVFRHPGSAFEVAKLQEAALAVLAKVNG